jgi:hypothetical protein
MNQKRPKKHTQKKSPDLFPATSGARAIDTPWVTPATLTPFTDLDDQFLRRRARETNPATASPWLPGPRGGKWPLHPTLIGLLDWYRHQLSTAATRALPAQCASMRDTEAIYGFPIEMQQYAREHHHPAVGAEVIFESSNRVNLPPLLAFFRPLWKKLFCKGAEAIKGIEDFESIDLDTQRALSAQQDVIQKKRENALATAQLHTRDGIEKEIGEPLTAIFSSLKSYEKITGGKLKSLLTGAGVDPLIIQQAIATATSGIQEPMNKLREQLKLDQPEMEKAA